MKKLSGIEPKCKCKEQKLNKNMNKNLTIMNLFICKKLYGERNKFLITNKFIKNHYSMDE
jgi:hypothetical protein